MEYDFMTLSPEDFEHLMRDLLSREWGSQLEAFKTGADKGIDLRYSKGNPSTGPIIVQCKRYAPNRFADLVRAMKDELTKIKALKSSRYVLVTSVQLSPQNKDVLLKLLNPYCQSSGDIFGPSEINGLLKRYPDIEKAHFKLWISSTAVLERLLNSRIFNLTEDTVDALQKQMCRLVMHNGFEKAQHILHDHHHVVIVGNPGIGKTTLAKMLMCHYIHEGFQPIVALGDVADAWEVTTAALKGPGKAVILYDDFLGQIRFDESKFHKNEERSLLALLKRATHSPNLRLLLTTREYILADARRLHGAFDENADSFMRCILSLEDYANIHRARILYNHLYFSDLPDSRLAALVKDKTYNSIIAHRHFSPRIVETVCNLANSMAMTDSQYVAYVVSQFEDPSRIWQHPFTNQISPTSRQLLQLLWSMGGHTDRASLEQGLLAINNGDRPEDVLKKARDSLKELDGNFIATERYKRAYSKKDDAVWIIRFQNPAVEEYVEKVILDDSILIERLITSATHFDQVELFLSCTENTSRRKPVLPHPPANFWPLLWNAASRTQDSKIGTRIKLPNDDQTYFSLDYEPSKSRRALALLNIAQKSNAKDASYSKLLNGVITVDGWTAFLSNATNDNSEPHGVKRLFTWLINESTFEKNQKLIFIESFREALRQTFNKDDAAPIEVDGVNELFDCFRECNIALTADEKKTFERVARSAADAAIDNFDDPDALDVEASALQKLASGIGFNADSLVTRVSSEAESLRENEPSDEDPNYDHHSYTSRESDSVSVDGLFATLLDR